MIPNKYEFTGEARAEGGVMLRRIRALHSFGVVKAGELGGWIEVEENLSHFGTCWVWDEAQVYGWVRVYDEAQVSGGLLVSRWGRACVRIRGRGLIQCEADWQVLGPVGARHDFITIHRDSEIGLRFSTGCFSGSRAELEAAVAATHGDNEHGRAYRAAIETSLEYFGRRGHYESR